MFENVVTMDEVLTLADNPNTRLQQVLVRCGGCRFKAAAQDVAHIVAALENADDYVRDMWT